MKTDLIYVASIIPILMCIEPEFLIRCILGLAQLIILIPLTYLVIFKL